MAFMRNVVTPPKTQNRAKPDRPHDLTAILRIMHTFTQLGTNYALSVAVEIITKRSLRNEF
jgi:hypothetical protein